MSTHINSNRDQWHLNLNQLESHLACSLKTKQVRFLLEMLTGKKITSSEILKQGRNNRLEIRYSCGKLIVLPSHRGKDSRLWEWDVIFSPTSFKQSA